MIAFGGTYYYIDFKAIEKCIGGDLSNKEQNNIDTEIKTYQDGGGNIISVETIERKYTRNKEIDGTKYSLILMMIETVLDYIDSDMNDTTLGEERALEKAPLPFKIAFNSLINEKIIKEK